MIGANAGLSVQIAATRVYRCVSRLAICRHAPNFFLSLFVLTSFTRRMDSPLILGAYIYLLESSDCKSLSQTLTASWGIPSLSTTSSQSKNHPQVRACACTGPNYPVCAMHGLPCRSAHWPGHLRAFVYPHFLFLISCRCLLPRARHKTDGYDLRVPTHSFSYSHSLSSFPFHFHPLSRALLRDLLHATHGKYLS